MRGTFPFRYQLIAKAIELTSMVPRKMCNRKGCTAKETNFRKRLWYPPAVITRRGVSQPFFIGGNGIKVNETSYPKHIRDNLIPAVEAMYPNKDFTFVQDSAPSHRANQVQNFLKQKLKSRFVKNTDWPPKSPDCNPLDYYFWDRIQENVYDGRYCHLFAKIDELKRRICDVWDECATDLPQIRKAVKQFLPRFEAVDTKEGGSIKTVFG